MISRFTTFKAIALWAVLTSAALLTSCDKEAEPLVIKVSSTPLSGGSTGGGTNNPGSGTITINNNGDGGVAIGADNTIVFTLKGRTYTLANSPSYQIAGATVSLFGFNVTMIGGTPSATLGDVDFALGSMASVAGVSDAYSADITLKDGTEYTLGTQGKINYNTFSSSSLKIASKGTFDLEMVNTKNATDKVKVSGSFNVK
jgi:hypothetical protein